MKKKSGCFGKLIKGLFVFFLLMLVIGIISSGNEKETSSATSTPRQTSPAATAPTATPAAVSTTAPTAEPAEEPNKPLEITLAYPARGAYGQYYTMNKNNENATAADKVTIVQYFVPAGSYTVTNESKYPSFVYVYSKEHIITDAGWEEPTDGWVSEMIQPGGSCDITVNEGYYLELHDNDVFKLVQK